MIQDANDPDRHAAQSARERGAFDDAVSAWRALLRRCPADWQAALAFKRDLLALGRYAESDPVFQQARRHFPDDIWAEHMASLYAFPQAELPASTARAAALAAASDDPGLHRLLGNMRLQARDYAAAAAAFDRDPASCAAARAARRYERLARMVAHAPASGITPAIVIINLDRNPDRLADIDFQFQSCQPPRFRVPGVEGSRLPASAIVQLGADPAMRGTLGCFLSHAAAWEAMLARGLPHCLIIEDDVIPLLPLPAHWGVFGIPRGFDICFVNDRLAPRAGRDGFEAVPLRDALHAFPPEDNAPGADGYLLSAAGARALLDWVAQDGFGGDVDWRLLAYGMTAAACDGLHDGHARDTLVRAQSTISRGNRLAAFVLTPPLIRTVPIASDREDGNRAGLNPPPSGAPPPLPTASAAALPATAPRAAASPAVG